MRKLFVKPDMQVATVNAASPRCVSEIKSSSGIEPTPPGLRVVSVLDISEGILKQCGIERGMHVVELACGAGDASLSIAKVVGPTGLVVGIDESAEAIDAAARRATVAGQCYWTRFVTADLDTFAPSERFDALIVRQSLFRRGERFTFLRLSSYIRPHGIIVIACGNLAGRRR